ncbi:MAG: XRE family transcriptional regulator [Pseudonocardiaceae bacterium]
MATPNDQLRAARERTASLAYPDGCLTRQELAELVNAWVWEHHNETVVLATANYIGKLEGGVIRWPGKLYREALRAILGVSTDAALGFVNARSRRAAVTLDNVKRQQLIRGTTALGVGTLVLGPVAALLDGVEPPPTPARVGASDIEQIRVAARVFTDWEARYGGGFARNAALAQLSWSAGLLEATCPDPLRPGLFSAVGDLAETAGTMAFDAGTHDDARRVFSFALGCAEEAEDWHLRATVLSTMAVQAIRTGRPDEALTLAELALVRADDRLTATERAMLHTDRGRALARMRRIQETLAAIGTADEHFGHSTPADDPPYMAFWDVAMHAGNTGQALFDLAILGHDPGAATNRLTTAIAGYSVGQVRSRAITQTKLASLTMATGDPLQAAALGVEALDSAGTIRSRRTLDDLRELNHHAAAHQNLEDIAHLRHRINTLLVRTGGS